MTPHLSKHDAKLLEYIAQLLEWTLNRKRRNDRAREHAASLFMPEPNQTQPTKAMSTSELEEE